MSQSLSSPNPMQPLSIGNIVTAGVRLYRSNLKTYLRLASFAHLWVLIPIYGWAKYFSISGIIARLAFGELVSQPESVSIARSHINPRMWSFLRVALQVFILLFLLLIVLYILVVVITVILTTVFTFLFAAGNSFIPVFVAGIISVAIFILSFTRYLSRWFLAEIPLAVEDNINGGESINRSWDLTKNSVWRIQGIVIVTFVVTLPIAILFSYLPRLLLLRFEPGSMAHTITYLIVLIMSLIGGIFLMPFWQTIKAVLYYDLRTRREGLGLRLRDRDI